MVRISKSSLLLVLFLILGLTAEAWAKEPAIVLTAFGTTTAASDTYRHIEGRVKERFPSYEIRWAFTSHKVRRKLAREQGKDLKDLPQVLKEVQAAGFDRVVVQSLHLVPGEEWQEVLRESRQIPGLKVALGQPLLSGATDESLVLAAVSRTFPADLQKTAVVLVGHGSPNPRGEQTYLAFEKLLRLRYPGRNVYLGMVSGQPERDAALAAIKRGGASEVLLVPFLLVAGEHVNTDILGDGPDSWKSRLRAQGISRVESRRQGLGYNADIINLYLDHLQTALRTLQD